ncbi:nuclear transport factor 2 family protein [Mangrovicoccus ximenensis]|uniref:nuclear transport factor 2 family protein n=1 Tax=Mangrovicoccus ximenensis TaxID=1911570 RepID=UPI000D3A02AE|nr:ester cyclase [Mangrovicoccus ximenensis]
MLRSADRLEDVPDLIRAATEEIWDRRGRSGAVRDFYHGEVVRKSPLGLAVGDAAAQREVMATASEFPDREILTEDVICRGLGGQGILASQRMVSRATHSGSGLFGAASGRSLAWRSMADRRVVEGRIAEEWVVTDTGGILRQLGQSPQAWMQAILDEGPVERPLDPETDPADPAQQPDPRDEAGARLADLVERLMGADFAAVEQCYDPGCALSYPGGTEGHGPQDADRFWLPLRAAFPDAVLTVHHAAGRCDPQMPPRATLRWSLWGGHSGWGSFGAPSQAMVHVMGITHAEFGPRGLRREWTLFDETAIWAQILAQRG